MGKIAHCSVGEKYGLWEVMDEPFVYRSKAGKTYTKVHVKCGCGRERDVAAHTLFSGKSTQCGRCRPKKTEEEKKEWLREFNKKKRKENIAAGLTADGNPRKRVFRSEAEKNEIKRQKEERRRLRQCPKRQAEQAKKNALRKREYMREYYKARRERDPSFKLKCNMRTLMYIALTGRAYSMSRDYSKSKSTMAYIGCTIEKLVVHLESQFSDGMSWENYGKWHVDHIKPLSWFDMTKESDRHKAWRYTNLQPLWATENIKKGNRVA